MSTSTRVVETWLQTLPFVDSAMVGPTLPADMSVWASSGFWQVTVVGGSPNVDLGTKEPVLEIACWAATPEATYPPFNRAERMATQVRDAALEARTQGLVDNVFLLGITPLTEPMRIPDERTGFARVSLQVMAWWNTLAVSG